jgi:hypothetical protein
VSQGALLNGQRIDIHQARQRFHDCSTVRSCHKKCFQKITRRVRIGEQSIGQTNLEHTIDAQDQLSTA